MKNFKLFRFKPQFLVIAVAFLSVCGMCNDDKEPDTLAADLSKVTFEADDTAEKSITVTSNTTWTSSRSDSWIETRQSENKLYIKVDNHANTSSSRTGTITLSAGDALPVTITVEQAAKKIDELSVNPTLLEYKANESGTKTVSVTTNSKDGWNATTDKSWITLSKKDNTLEVKVGAHTGSTERTGSIKVTAGNAPEKTITVNQAAEITLTVSPKSLEFDYKSGEKNISVNSNATDWTYSKPSSDSWITVTKSSSRLTVAVSEYTGSSSRSSSIKITAGDKEETVTVKQVKKEDDITIKTNPTSLSFAYNNPPDQNIQVTTNASTWTATTPVSWLTLTKSGQTLRVRATTNSNTARSATITFNADNGKATSTVSVSQAGQPINPLPPEFAIVTGSGTPEMLQNPGPKDWAGIWSLVSGSRYSMTGWGGTSIKTYLNYNASTKNFTIDHSTVVVTDGDIKGHFVAFAVSNNTITVIADFPFPYNNTAQTINFGGRYNGVNVWVGVIGITGSLSSSSGFTFKGVFTECYSNAKIVFDIYSDAPQTDNNPAIRSIKFSGEKMKLDLKSIKKVEVKRMKDL